MEKEEILTSVKVNKELFETFKIECAKRKFSLNKLVNRAIALYISDQEFKKQITNTKN
jgi:predicted HicB family RNase H-like nuclease